MGPIFLTGILQRSGTNYLNDLLLLHPDCVGSQLPVPEDYFLRESHHLMAYAKSLSSFWQETWGGPNMEARLLRAFGDGLLRLAGDSTEKRVVVKTPSVYNINHFPGLFPSAKLLILVRDCRAVVESAVRSFGGSYEYWLRMWAYTAKLIQQFDEQHSNSVQKNYMIVKYEDLVVDCKTQIGKIMLFLELDPGRYDYLAAEALPIRGSSTQRGENTRLHWQPVPKTEDFKPLDRYKDWTPALHHIANWIAGEEMRSLSYHPHEVGHSPYHVLLNLGREIRWRIANKLGIVLGRPPHRETSEKAETF